MATGLSQHQGNQNIENIYYAVSNSNHTLLTPIIFYLSLSYCCSSTQFCQFSILLSHNDIIYSLHLSTENRFNITLAVVPPLPTSLEPVIVTEVGSKIMIQLEVPICVANTSTLHCYKLWFDKRV